MEPDFLKKKIGQIWAKKRLKNGFFGLSEKLDHFFFLIFDTKVGYHRRYMMALADFHRKFFHRKSLSITITIYKHRSMFLT